MKGRRKSDPALIAAIAGMAASFEADSRRSSRVGGDIMVDDPLAGMDLDFRSRGRWSRPIFGPGSGSKSSSDKRDSRRTKRKAEKKARARNRR